MRNFSPFYSAIICSLLIIVFGLSHALLRHPPYAPIIQTPLKFGSAAADERAMAETGAHAPSGSPVVGNKDGEHEATEFWPPVLGYRLKITDTFVAGFTALLFFATVALWLATRRLVTGADDATRRQLRAYLSMNPKIFFNFVVGGFAQIEFLQRNHGKTPAFKITHIFDIAVFPNPLPAGFTFPAPTRAIHTNHTIFPGDEAKGWFNRGIPVTAEEIAAVTAYTHKIHVWGVTTYQDAFHKIRETKFSASAGGSNFVEAQRLAASGKLNGPPWNWDYESEHNQST